MTTTSSSLVASELNAERLVLLTDVDGVYDKNPFEHPDAVLLSEWDDAVDTTAEAGAGVAAWHRRLGPLGCSLGMCRYHRIWAGPLGAWIALAGGHVGTRFTPKGTLTSRRLDCICAASEEA